MQVNVLEGGFSDASIESAIAFRAMIEAMARPGTIQHLDFARPPAPLSVAAGTCLLTLADGTTPIHLMGCYDCPDVRSWIEFHIGAPIIGNGSARGSHPSFAVGTLSDLIDHQDVMHLGDPDFPDRATTVILEVGELTNTGAHLTGPGIKTTANLSIPEHPLFVENSQHFPLGLDFFFTHSTALAALPRSTKVEFA